MGSYHLFQTAIRFATLIPLIQMQLHMERSYEAPISKDLMRTILLGSNHRLKLFI